MSLITYLNPQALIDSLPNIIASPYSLNPHNIVQQACLDLQNSLDQRSDIKKTNGQMFGVAVVLDQQGKVGYLSAFSGTLNQLWLCEGFVPPVFNVAVFERQEGVYQNQLRELQQTLIELKQDEAYCALLAQYQEQKHQSTQALDELKQEIKRAKATRKRQREAAELIAPDARSKLLDELSKQGIADSLKKKKAEVYWKTLLENLEGGLAFYQGRIDELIKTIDDAKQAHKQQAKHFYNLINPSGETQSVSDFFDSDDLVPDGTGDCATIKLLNYANGHGLRVLGFMEFWWGQSPKSGIRHHAQLYAPCRGKCHPLLPFLLHGYEVEERPIPVEGNYTAQDLDILYEDDELLVVNKPEGLLSVPGKEISDSVESRLHRRYPTVTIQMLLHRLDMATSGLLVAAKTAKVHKALHKQFEKRIVKKRYIAILSKRLNENLEKGFVELPLRPDLDDRPRQMVCYEHGRQAKTEWEILSLDDTTTRVAFYPLTGRTHQLRMHAAHKMGLNAPIKGDRLYGLPEDRLYLHAETLGFTHPISGDYIEFHSPVPF